ncbi:telo2 interacting protein 1 [Oratosquilla oratoria]|uniref:telo2 interacting protein 1 n=1 Tax=Oratosquilla oratoria TaxID=337810 RepID=UPI003F75871B
MDPQEAFMTLQPLCVHVARDVNEVNLKALRLELERLTVMVERNGEVWCCLNDLKEYIVFPLIIALKSGKANSSAVLEELVLCLLIVLRHSQVDTFQYFQDIFTQLFMLISDKKNPQKLGAVSEECKEHVLRAVEVLVQHSSSDVTKRVYHDSFRPQLGHGIYMCLQILSTEKNRNLKVCCMEVLLALGQKHNKEMWSIQEMEDIGQVFSNFLPGIVLGLGKVATGDDKQGQRVISMSLHTWCYFVVLVLNDKFLNKNVSNFSLSDTASDLRKKIFGDEKKKQKTQKSLKEKKSKFDLPEPEDELPPEVPRLKNVSINREWIKSTCEKVVLVVHNLCERTVSDHWKISLALVELSSQILQNCQRSLAGAVIPLVEVLLKFRCDDVVDVSQAAQRDLTQLMHELVKAESKGRGNRDMYELLEESIYSLATRLPTITREGDDNKTLSTTRLLEGYLEVLGPRLRNLVGAFGHTHRLFRAVLFILRMDSDDSNLLLEKAGTEDPLEVYSINPHLGMTFKNFQDHRILHSVSTAVRLMGHHGNLQGMIDVCLDLLEESAVNQKEVVLLLTLLLTGKSKSLVEEDEQGKVEEIENIVQNILDIVNTTEVFNAPISLSSVSSNKVQAEVDENLSLVPVNSYTNISVEQIKSNIVLVSNVLRLIGACAEVMGPNFIMFLSVTLCSILEKAGEPNVLVSNTANNTLKTIAEVCKYKNVAQLIEKSIPHFWFTLSLRLRRLNQFPTAPLVLQVALEYAGFDVLAFTEELVEDILLSLDTHYSEHATPILRVMFVYVSAVARLMQERKEEHSNDNEKVHSEGTSKQAEHSNSLGPVALCLLKHHKKNQEAQVPVLDSDDDEEPVDGVTGMQEHLKAKAEKENEMEEDGTITEEKKKPVPRYIELVVMILERCSHLLYTNDRKVKLVVLSIVKVATKALSYEEDERLPVLHKLWKPLMNRLNDKDFVVMIKTVEALAVMISTSAEFLQRRVLKEALPKIMNFLKSQGETSQGKNQHSGYHLSAAYRAQRIIMQELRNILISFPLRTREASEFVNMLIIYADKRQPPDLCSQAVKLLSTMSELYPHHVWLALAFQQQPMKIVAPSSTLSSVKIFGIKNKNLPPDVQKIYEDLS